MILHIFMYNVISDFSAVTPASEGRVKIQQKGSPESFKGVGLNSFQELALIFS